MYKNLVISDNKEIWSKTRKNILVGNWCANNSHKFEKKENYKVLNYHWSSRKKIKKDLKYLLKLYKFLLNNLTKNLNTFHNCNYPKRYWEILLSRWLWMYLVFFFDRWEIIKNINKKYKKLFAKTINYNSEQFVPQNTTEFSEFCNSNIFNNDWNHWVFTEILKFSTKIKLKYINFKKKNLRVKKVIKKNTNYNQEILNLFLNTISSKKIFTQNLFYGKISENIFNLSFGQFRNNIFFTQKFKKNKVDFNLREKFLKIKKKKINKFEKFIILQIKKNLPKIFCENYVEATDLIEKLKLPVKPKVIMTSLDHHFNDAFKLYTAKNILLGSKFYIFQHGGSYGISDLYMTEKLDIKLSDKFFTWGWKEKNKKIKRFFCQRHYYINPKIIKNNDRKGIIIPITEMLLSPGNIASGRPRNKTEINDYIEIIDTFLMNITSDIKKTSAIKTLNNPPTNYVYKSLKFKFPNFNFIKSDQNTFKFLNKYKLYIETVNSTGYLESLRLNFPTILIFNNQICSIRKSAQKEMKLLKEVNILFNCPKKAAKFVNKNYLNLDKWWSDKYLQKARRRFCNKFVRTSLNPYKDFKKFI